jgi:hypothetical protein
MNGYDSANSVRSRYDYYYSISSPSLSQATKYYESQASLFGEPVVALLPQPIQKSPSPSHIPTPLTPYNRLSSSSTLGAHTNFATNDVHSSLIENFDNHLFESIRQNIIGQNSDNQIVSNDLTRHQIWTQQQQQQSSTSSNSPPPSHSQDELYENERKRSKTAFDFYRNDRNNNNNNNSNSTTKTNNSCRTRTLSAQSDMK